MREALYSIGEVSRTLGMSIPTIRHYEKMNLIKPSYVNRDTRYRYYNMVSFWDLEVIRTCRNLGFSIKEINDLKNSKSLTDQLNMVQVLKDRTKSEIERCQKTYRDLEWLEDKWTQNEQQLREPQVTPVCRCLPKMKVMRVSIDDVEPEYRNADCHVQQARLHLEIQKKTRKKMEQGYSYRVDYGYELDMESLKDKKISITSEWAHLEDYDKVSRTSKLAVMPAGRYVCFRACLWKDDSWMDTVVEYLKEQHLTPKKIYAEELSLYLYEYRDICHEIRVLVQ